MIIEVDGLKVIVTNWDEFKEKLLNAIAYGLENEIVAQIDKMKLVDTGLFKQISSSVVNDSIIIESAAPYAAYLEYGTFDYYKRYGQDNFPKKGYPSIPKKKELRKSEAMRLPKGMQPFAPFRRVLYNQNVMNRVIEQGLKWATD